MQIIQFQWERIIIRDSRLPRANKKSYRCQIPIILYIIIYHLSPRTADEFKLFFRSIFIPFTLHRVLCNSHWDYSYRVCLLKVLKYISYCSYTPVVTIIIHKRISKWLWFMYFNFVKTKNKRLGIAFVFGKLE